MHAYTAACEKGEATTTSAGGTTLPLVNNGKEIAGEKVESGAGAVEGEKEEKKYDVVVDLLGGQ
jgi:co-chaperonin GroES (HSP10)